MIAQTVIYFPFIHIIVLYVSFKQEFTHTSLIKAHLASKLFINTVSETIAIKANTQLSSGYQKLRGLPRIPGYDVNQLQKVY